MARELYIGLGGTGGNVLKELHKLLSADQKNTPSYLYLDTDLEKGVKPFSKLGIGRAVWIGRTDTVGQLADRLDDRGLLEWMPPRKPGTEDDFYGSGLTDGASQIRLKSRLCFDYYLKNDAAGLKDALKEISQAGKNIVDYRPNVIIVASVAGGTGAGCFIQTALYVREYFRNLQQPVKITALLGLPDLFIGSTGVEEREEKEKNMTANAYAAIRELNALNLAAGQNARDAAKKDSGYGKGINIKIASAGEGTLFDSNDATFSEHVTAKPFDLIYFFDSVNAHGGALGMTEDCYKVMADVAFSRLYSDLNEEIQSGESNELSLHIQFPTAIYGGAGYGRIIYPYDDIIEYISLEKLAEELNAKWLYAEDLWNNERKHLLEESRRMGKSMPPLDKIRGKYFIETIDGVMSSAGKAATFGFLNDMVHEKSGVVKLTRDKTYRQKIEAAVESFRQVKESRKLLDYTADSLKNSCGEFSPLKDENVRKAVLKTFSALQDMQIERDVKTGKIKGTADKALRKLTGGASAFEDSLGSLITAISDSAERFSARLSSEIFPTSRDMIALSNEQRSPLSIKYGLLQHGEHFVHPIAARYLLYKLASDINADVSACSRADYDDVIEDIKFALDDDRSDNDYITVSREAEKLKKSLFFPFQKETIEDDVKRYTDKALEGIRKIFTKAENNIVDIAFRNAKPAIDELVRQYESFFRAVEKYRDGLGLKIRDSLLKHSGTGDQNIYVCGSEKAKRALASEKTVEEALYSNPDALYGAAGEGVYVKLEELARTNLEIKGGAEEQVRDRRAKAAASDAFKEVLAKYAEILREKATGIDMNVFDALVHEIAVNHGTTPAQVPGLNGGVTFTDELQNYFKDLFEKAQPMIRYNVTNEQQYYEGENPGSTTYYYFGFDRSAAESLAGEGCSEAEAKKKLEGYLALVPSVPDFNVKITDDKAKKHEIFCFEAVHCTQPTQIYHFTESDRRDSYYPKYRQRIAEMRPDACPHLDIRWMQRSSMPYISKNLELAWRKTALKAFLYEAMAPNQLEYTYKEGRRCFLRKNDSDKTEYPTWRDGSIILLSQSSRIIEYIAGDEQRAEREAKAFDALVEKEIEALSQYTGFDATYKSQMTNNRLLKILRSHVLFYRRTIGERDLKLSEDVTKGVLDVAFELHRSEERLREDKDYGEMLLDIVAEIIGKFADAYSGDSDGSSVTDRANECKEIFNHTFDKFFEAWLEDHKAQRGTGADEATGATEATEATGASDNKAQSGTGAAEKKKKGGRKSAKSADDGSVPRLGAEDEDESATTGGKSSEAEDWLKKNWLNRKK